MINIIEKMFEISKCIFYFFFNIFSNMPKSLFVIIIMLALLMSFNYKRGVLFKLSMFIAVLFGISAYFGVNLFTEINNVVNEMLNTVSTFEKSVTNQVKSSYFNSITQYASFKSENLLLVRNLLIGGVVGISLKKGASESGS